MPESFPVDCQDPNGTITERKTLRKNSNHRQLVRISGYQHIFTMSTEWLPGRERKNHGKSWPLLIVELASGKWRPKDEKTARVGLGSRFFAARFIAPFNEPKWSSQLLPRALLIQLQELAILDDAHQYAPRTCNHLLGTCHHRAVFSDQFGKKRNRNASAALASFCVLCGSLCLGWRCALLATPPENDPCCFSSRLSLVAC